jgi:hypothetical protein
VPDTKICPDCAETVKAEARVCRFCGFRFDLAEERQREAEEEAGLSWWERTVRSIERAAEQREAAKPPKVRTKSPMSCCGCSCGSSGVVAALVFALVAFGTGLGLVASIVAGVVSSVAAVHALNFAARRPVVSRALRFRGPV